MIDILIFEKDLCLQYFKSSIGICICRLKVISFYENHLNMECAYMWWISNAVGKDLFCDFFQFIISDLCDFELHLCGFNLSFSTHLGYSTLTRIPDHTTASFRGESNMFIWWRIISLPLFFVLITIFFYKLFIFVKFNVIAILHLT